MTATATWLPVDNFGMRLHTIRFAKNMSAAEFGEICGVTEKAVLAWERGATPKNQLEIIDRICDAFNVERDFLTLSNEYAPRDLNPEPADYWSDFLKESVGDDPQNSSLHSVA